MGTITFIKPPFNEETARAKVKAAQDTWNRLILLISSGVIEVSSLQVEKQL